MRKTVLSLAFVAAACSASLLRAPRIRTSVWLNADPDGLGDLSGRVVLVEFWTYG